VLSLEQYTDNYRSMNKYYIHSSETFNVARSLHHFCKTAMTKGVKMHRPG